MGDILKTDIIQWDIRSWSVALDYWEKNIDWDNVQNCLELGAREGGLSLWLAMKQKDVVCSDFKDTNKSAQPLHIKYKAEKNIHYQDIDATNIPYENYFDIIVFKSIIGGIGYNNNHEKQKQVFSEIFKALKPGGSLLFAENLIASGLHQKVRKKYVNWGQSWRYVTIQEVNAFLAPYSNYTIKANGVIASFGRNEAQRSMLSTLDFLVFNRIFPDKWKYITYGIATK